MIINLARIDFCPGSGGSADIQGEKVVAITENGTATITPDAGYDGIAVVKANVNVQPNLGTLDADPTTSTQVISAESEGYDGFSSVTIEAVDATIDSNIVAGNIKKDVEILGVTGTFDNQKPEETLTQTITSNGTQTFTPTSGYVYDEAVITVDVYQPTEVSLSETITDNGTHTYTPETGYVYDSVEIEVDVQPRLQYKAVDATTQGVYVDPDTGYDALEQVFVNAVDATIDSNIVAGNIKKDVEILGVTGTFEGGTTPTGTISITSNGTFDVTDYASASVNVGGTDYRYKTGTVTGLDQIGWDSASIGMYEQNADYHYAWENDKYALSQENIDLYSLDDPYPALYKDDPKITFVPKKNMQSYFTIQSNAFQNMKYIKGIPMYDTSSVNSMLNMFNNCTALQTIPFLDTSLVTNMSGMFYQCSSLTTIPELDTSLVTDMNQMFYKCSSLTSIPELDTGLVTNMSQMFYNCSKLTSIPELDTSSATNMSNMFYFCSSLTTIPELDTSSVTNMQQMFYNCNKLTSIPELDTSSATNMRNMFAQCSSLTSIPELDTSSVTDMYMMFDICSSLTTVNGIDFSSLSSAPGYFLNNIGSAITHFIVNGSISFSWTNAFGGLQRLTNIDYASVKSILQAMGRCTNPETAKTMQLNRTIADQGGELAALVADCQSKGWTITGLTLQ